MATRAWTALLLVCLTVTRPTRAQSPARPWEVTVTAGAFAIGTGRSLSHWMRRNGYGLSRQRCGFDVLLQRMCTAAEPYPQSKTSRFAGALSVRRALTERASVEVFGSNEQSGTVTGFCDVTATPRDPRCTDAFLDVEFSGASVASLVEMSFGKLHVGAGPAVLFANWDLKPAHLAGLWLDAAYNIGARPLLVRAQYRVYRPTTRSPAQGFNFFHPSTLFLGLGFVVRGEE